MENSNSSSSTGDNGKTIAIVSYLTLIGWIVALILHNGNKTTLGSYHLRQMLGLMILAVAVGILKRTLFMIPFMGLTVLWAFQIGLLVLWIAGIVNAATGKEKPVPVVGGLFQKWFAGFAL